MNLMLAYLVLFGIIYYIGFALLYYIHISVDFELLFAIFNNFNSIIESIYANSINNSYFMLYYFLPHILSN